MQGPYNTQLNNPAILVVRDISPSLPAMILSSTSAGIRSEHVYIFS